MSRFRIGRYECAVIATGPLGPYPAADYCVNASPEEAAEMLGATEVMTGLNCLLLRDGERVILIDSGLGMLVPDGTQRLRDLLAKEGVAPEDITLVLTSHCHPDHIGGHAHEGKPAFPRATYAFSKLEWDHFMGGTGVEMFDSAAQALLPPLEAAGVVEWFSAGEIARGIEAIDAPGHTPGHVAFGITDGGQRAIYAADALLFPRHAERPELYSVFDWDGPKSAESRAQLIRRAAGDHATLVVFHLEAPGIGMIEQSGDAYRWIAGLPQG